MTLLLRSVFYTLAITIILSTGTLGLLLPQSLLPAITAPSLLPSLSQSKPKINSSFELALNATDPFTLCYDKADQPDLIRDQCMEALVNSDFAGLPPTDTLTFMPRSPRLVHGQIGLPRRYQSCRSYSSAPNIRFTLYGVTDAEASSSGWQMCN